MPRASRDDVSSVDGAAKKWNFDNVAAVEEDNSQVNAGSSSDNVNNTDLHTIHDKYKAVHEGENLSEIVDRRVDVLYNDSKVRKLR